jgi:hypothetical protein
MSTALEPRVSDLEISLKELAYAQLRTERSLEELANELKDFKHEMSDFKNEMKDFKNEMKDFKDESMRQSREMNKRWGDLANRLGTVVEDMVAPNIPGIMARYFGVEEPDLLMVRPRKKHPLDQARRREFDVIAVAGNRVFLNETRSRLKTEDIISFSTDYREVVEYFPEYSNHEIIPIMSSLYLTEDLVTLLTRHGIYTMAMSDDTMDLLNAQELQK